MIGSMFRLPLGFLIRFISNLNRMFHFGEDKIQLGGGGVGEGVARWEAGKVEQVAF